MGRSELELIEWLAGRVRSDASHLVLGIGDDMSIVDTGAGNVLTTSDLLADGVHFDTRTQALAGVGHKCIACSLSDCAAMAVQPRAATVSAALPRGMSDGDLEQLFDGMTATARRFDCPIAGGDTVVWDNPLVVDVSISAVPYPGIAPVRRSGARPGDVLYVTGPLGGSLLGRHLTFTPRVAEARMIAQALGTDLHAMIDLSDGLSLDLYRLCRASGVGAKLNEALLQQVVSEDAKRASRQDGRTPLDHLLNDGEDFELLVSVADHRADAKPDDHARTSGASPRPERKRGDRGPVACPGALGGSVQDRDTAHGRLADLSLSPVGVVTENGLLIETQDARLEPLRPEGYQHRI